MNTQMGTYLAQRSCVLGKSTCDNARHVLSNILFKDDGSPSSIVLKLGKAGICTLARKGRLSRPMALEPETWTQSCTYWASVTPIVLDRFPKTDRINDRVGWNQEVAGIVATACGNIGLPSPVAIRVEKTPFFRGSLRDAGTERVPAAPG